MHEGDEGPQAKRMDTPILKGYQIYHNFFLLHEALHCQIPSERAGIKVEGENKWLAIIQNASHVPTLNKEKKSGDVPRPNRARRTAGLTLLCNFIPFRSQWKRSKRLAG